MTEPKAELIDSPLVGVVNSKTVDASGVLTLMSMRAVYPDSGTTCFAELLSAIDRCKVAP